MQRPKLAATGLWWTVSKPARKVALANHRWYRWLTAGVAAGIRRWSCAGQRRFAPLHAARTRWST